METGREDKWKPEPFDESQVKHEFLETSSFEIMFPKYREKYVREAWKYIKAAMERKKLAVDIDLHRVILTVSTTKKTRDPYVILKARDALKLVSRGVPLEKAYRVLEDDLTSDVIQINGLVKKKETFLKRRERLVGPDGNTLKSLELLTDCYIHVHGNTVSAIGAFKNLREVRSIVLGCMNNVHPIYEIKRLMVRKELEKDPNMKNESWDRYLPKYRKTHEKKNPEKKKEEAAEMDRRRARENSIPNPPEKRKIDVEIETGEYFLTKSQKEKKKRSDKRLSSEEKRRAKEEEQCRDSVPPDEKKYERKTPAL